VCLKVCSQRFALPSVGGFGNRLPGGNDEKKCDDKIIEMVFRKSHAPNHCCHVAKVDVTMSCPQLRKCIVACWRLYFGLTILEPPLKLKVQFREIT